MFRNSSYFIYKIFNIYFITLLFSEESICSPLTIGAIDNGLTTDELLEFENMLLTDTKSYMVSLQDFYNKAKQNSGSISPHKLFLSKQKIFLNKLHEINLKCLKICSCYLRSGKYVQKSKTRSPFDCIGIARSNNVFLDFDFCEALSEIIKTSKLICDDLFEKILRHYQTTNVQLMTSLCLFVTNAFDFYYKNIVFFAVFCIRINRKTIENSGFVIYHNILDVLKAHYSGYISSNNGLICLYRRLLDCKMINAKSKDSFCLHNFMPGCVEKLIKESIAQKTEENLNNLQKNYKAFLIYCQEITFELSKHTSSPLDPMCAATFSTGAYPNLEFLPKSAIFIDFYGKVMQTLKRLYECDNKKVYNTLLWFSFTANGKKNQYADFNKQFGKFAKKIIYFFENNLEKTIKTTSDLLSTCELSLDSTRKPFNGEIFSFSEIKKIDTLKKEIYEAIEIYRKFENLVLKSPIFRRKKLSQFSWLLAFYIHKLQAYGNNLTYLCFVLNQMPKPTHKLEYKNFDKEHAKKTFERILTRLQTIRDKFSQCFVINLLYSFSRLRDAYKYTDMMDRYTIKFCISKLQDYVDFSLDGELSLFIDELNRLLKE